MVCHCMEEEAEEEDQLVLAVPPSHFFHAIVNYTFHNHPAMYGPSTKMLSYNAAFFLQPSYDHLSMDEVTTDNDINAFILKQA